MTQKSLHIFIHNGVSKGNLHLGTQQNGEAKRKNQTIMNMARSMIKAKNLANEFWVEVVACSA